MPKNPDSPPWENHREITSVNSQDLEYVKAKAADEYSELLLDLFSKGETTFTESAAKVHFPLESEMIIKKVFLILVQDGRLTGPEGRLRTFTIDATWAAEKTQERKELEELKKAIEEEEDQDDDQYDDVSSEEGVKGTSKLKDRPEGRQKKKRALKDASNILSGNQEDSDASVNTLTKKNRRKIDMDRSDPVTEVYDSTTATSVLNDLKDKETDLVGILKAKAEPGLEEKLMHDVNEQLTITLQGAEDGIPVSVAQSRCTEISISREDFFKVLKWKHDQNHIFVDGEITDPSSTIYPM